MLGHGLCSSLCLADINPEAVQACQRTVSENVLSDRVSVYCSDNLLNIPATERWDLVVSNPPHFIDDYIGSLRAHDPDWHLHREFLRTVGPFLQPGGVILLQENNAGSTVETFRPMIEQSGLKVAFTWGDLPFRTVQHQFYFIGIVRAGDVAPPWARAVATSVS